jgi:hypothetical protein
MSVEIATVRAEYSDDLASTSLISTSITNHNNANVSSAKRSKNDSHTEQHKVHFDIIAEDGDKKQKISSNFVRAIPSPKNQPAANVGLASRLSMAIRRSLRLGPKQRSTAVVREDMHRGVLRFGEDKNVSFH